MTSTVPGVIEWLVIVLMAITLAARFVWCRTNAFDNYLINVMAWTLLTQLLRDRGVEAVLSRGALLTITAAQQLAFVAMIFTATEVFGFIMLWQQRTPADTAHHQRYYRLAAAVLSVLFLIAATRARVAGQTLEISGGWDGVAAWAVYLLMLEIVAVRVTKMARLEMKKSRGRREYILAIAGIGTGLFSLAACLEAFGLAVTEQLGWTHTVQARLWFHGFDFFTEAVLIYLFGAVPLILKLLSHMGLDQVSRSLALLGPLRSGILAAAPESAFGPEAAAAGLRKTPLQLHQAVIEIRDGILRLRPYFAYLTDEQRRNVGRQHRVGAGDEDVATYAFQLAYAARAKRDNLPPLAPTAAALAHSGSATLDDDVAQLLKVAKYWAPAVTAAQRADLTDIDEQAASTV